MCTSNIGEDNVERLGRDASSILDRCPKYVSLVPMSGLLITSPNELWE